MKFDNVMRSFATVLVGVLLVLMKGSAIHLIVRIIGVAFLVPALVSAFGIMMEKRKGFTVREILVLVADVSCVLLGVWLLVAPGMFVDLLVVLLALALFCFSVYQLYRLYLVKMLVGGGWRYAVAPLVLVVVSVVALALPDRTASFITVLIGLSAIVSGLSDIVVSLLVDKKK